MRQRRDVIVCVASRLSSPSSQIEFSCQRLSSHVISLRLFCVCVVVVVEEEEVCVEQD